MGSDPVGNHSQGSPARIPTEEIRLAVVLNGGVSLAVWMGGVSNELNRLSRGQGPYRTLLALTGNTARIDVIAGTSAGGINGACLALAQANKAAKVEDLRDIWADQGRIESLLRQPFRGSPTSLLQGDEFFLPRLNAAMHGLTTPYEETASEEHPIDLTITTTLLRGAQTITVDSTGQQLPQSIHDGRFHFRRDPGSATDPFAAANIARTADQLALAARCTASFPVAFEPSFVPVNAGVPSGPGLSEDDRVRPDMGRVPGGTTQIASWGDGGRPTADDGPAPTLSRFVVDGGLLANMPTRSALQAIDSMPASGPVRRVVLLVHPHAPTATRDMPDEQDKPLTLMGSVGAILGALSAQGSRTFVDELEKHNVMAAGRRGTRADVLAGAIGTPDLAAPPRAGDAPAGAPAEGSGMAHPEGTALAGLASLVGGVYPHYRRLRMWRAGRDVATLAPKHEAWNYERIRRNAQSAQETWLKERQGAAAAGGSERPGLPYVPTAAPLSGVPQPAGWGWGVSAAVGVADAAADLLRTLIWVLPKGDDYDKVLAARTQIDERRSRIQGARRFTDAIWREDPVIRTLEPNESLFRLRVAWYERMMTVLSVADGTRAEAEMAGLIALVADHAAEHNPAAVAAAATSPIGAAMRHSLLGEELPDGSPQSPTAAEAASAPAPAVGDSPEPTAGAAGSAGRYVRTLVDEVLMLLGPALVVLREYCAQVQSRTSGLREHEEGLVHWRNLLAPDTNPRLAHDELLDRLLALEVATTALGDEVPTENSLPVEIVQLSAMTRNGFMEMTRSGDDKLGGMSINRFGGFLKRSWRLNDWTWGRLDAATVLCRLVLDPVRLRRALVLREELAVTSIAAAEAATQTVDRLIVDLFGMGDPPVPDLGSLRARAMGELAAVYLQDNPVGDLPPAMPALAELAAWSIHIRVAREELPALARGIRADGVEGANRRSNGAVLLAEQEPLLARLEAARSAEPCLMTREWLADGAAGLRAFDRAGVGRESLREEGTSDQMIRTSATAAAVAATVIDSDSSGLGAAKPITRGLRGAMLLPYWVITALSAGGVLSRALAMLSLAVGGVLVALSLFGVLSGGAAGTAAAVGTSALLVAFAYGALRTGTLLHGVVLLSPVIPLAAFAATRDSTGSDPGGATATAAGAADASAAVGVSTMLVVVALALGLMVLGSLPAPMSSVWAALDRLGDRAHLPRVPPLQRPGPLQGSGTQARLRDGLTRFARRSARGLRQTWRRTRAIAIAVWRPLLGLGLLVAVTVLATRWVPILLDTATSTLDDRPDSAFAVVGAVVLVGALLAGDAGRQLRVLAPDPGSPPSYHFRKVSHPVGVAVGWSVVYGLCYLSLAVLMVMQPWGWLETPLGEPMLATAAIFGIALLVLVPALLPIRARLQIRREALDLYARTGGPEPLPALPAATGAQPTPTPAPGVPDTGQAVLADLIRRGQSYRFLVTTDRAGEPTLARAGRSLARRVNAQTDA